MPTSRDDKLKALNSATTRRHMAIRQALKGPNGQALLDYLMDEYIYNVPETTDPTQLAKNAGQADLVLRLRRNSME